MPRMLFSSGASMPASRFEMLVVLRGVGVVEVLDEGSGGGLLVVGWTVSVAIVSGSWSPFIVDWEESVDSAGDGEEARA